MYIHLAIYCFFFFKENSHGTAANYARKKKEKNKLFPSACSKKLR